MAPAIGNVTTGGLGGGPQATDLLATVVGLAGLAVPKKFRIRANYPLESYPRTFAATHLAGSGVSFNIFVIKLNRPLDGRDLAIDTARLFSRRKRCEVTTVERFKGI